LKIITSEIQEKDSVLCDFINKEVIFKGSKIGYIKKKPKVSAVSTF